MNYSLRWGCVRYYRAAMILDDFDYSLPDELIARHPPPERTLSRLLCVPYYGGLRDGQFAQLPAELRPGDLLVLNDTRVIPARLRGHKATGGAIELLVERILESKRALVHLKSNRTPAIGAGVRVAGADAQIIGRHGALFEIALIEADWPALLAAEGEIPLPPYIDRPPVDADFDRYQTVYARHDGAVAAPTAGLHFDVDLLSAVRRGGVNVAFVTLHVGAGTFQPIRVTDPSQHEMHPEWLDVSAAVCEQVIATRARNGRVVAVGTTVVRSLETAALETTSPGVPLAPYRGDSRLFITPGFRFQVVDRMVTNFHLPRTTLMMLVAAFVGRERVLAAYAHAVARRYRFFSYGDAMLLDRQ